MTCDNCISCEVCHAVKLASKMDNADVLCEHFVDKDLINRQREEIDDLNFIVGIKSKRKYYRKFIDEVYHKEKGNELCEPDFDYIYELYFKQKEEIERLKENNQYLDDRLCTVYRLIGEMVGDN